MSRFARLELRGFPGGHVETDLRGLHGLSHRQWSSEVGLANPEACRQVCSASFTFLKFSVRWEREQVRARGGRWREFALKA